MAAPAVGDPTGCAVHGNGVQHAAAALANFPSKQGSSSRFTCPWCPGCSAMGQDEVRSPFIYHRGATHVRSTPELQRTPAYLSVCWGFAGISMPLDSGIEIPANPQQTLRYAGVR